jgi:hypothetical protein
VRSPLSSCSPLRRHGTTWVVHRRWDAVGLDDVTHADSDSASPCLRPPPTPRRSTSICKPAPYPSPLSLPLSSATLGPPLRAHAYAPSLLQALPARVHSVAPPHRPIVPSPPLFRFARACSACSRWVGGYLPTPSSSPILLFLRRHPAPGAERVLMQPQPLTRIATHSHPTSPRRHAALSTVGLRLGAREGGKLGDRVRGWEGERERERWREEDSEGD